MRPWTRTYDPPSETTKLEQAIIDIGLESNPAWKNATNRSLKVYRRHWTVKGWYVNFIPDPFDYVGYNEMLDVYIEANGIQDGGGAVAFVSPEQKIIHLELFAYGDMFAETVGDFVLTKSNSVWKD